MHVGVAGTEGAPGCIGVAARCGESMATERWEPLLTRRQQAWVAGGLLVLLLIVLIWVPGPRGQPSPPADEAPGRAADAANGGTVSPRVRVRGVVRGLDAARVHEAQIVVRLARTRPRPPEAEPAKADGRHGPPPERGEVIVGPAPSGAFEADVSHLAAELGGELVEVKLTATHPASVRMHASGLVRLQAETRKTQVVVLDVDFPPSIRIVGRASGSAGEAIAVSHFDLTQSLELTKASQIIRLGGIERVLAIETLSLEEGQPFEFRGRRGHLLFVLATSPTRLAAWRVIEPDRTEDIDLGELVVERGASLEGTVQASEILGPPEVRAFIPMSLRGLELNGRGEPTYAFTLVGPVPRSRSVKPDVDGRFRIQGLPPSVVHLNISFGPSPRTDGGLLRTWAITNRAERKLRAPASDVRLEARASILRVRLQDAQGDFVEGPFEFDFDGEWSQTAGSAADAGYLVPADCAFSIRPVIDGPQFEPVLGKTPREGEERAVTIPVRPAPPSGSVRLMLPESPRFAHWTANWTRMGGQGRSRSSHHWFDASELQAGVAVIDDLPPGQYVFQVVPSSVAEGEDRQWWITKPVEVEVEAEQTSDVRIPVERGGRWAVKVTRSDTGTVPRCSVILQLSSEERRTPEFGREDELARRMLGSSARLDSERCHALDPLPAGTYQVRFEHALLRNRVEALTIKPGETTLLEVVLEPW